MAYNRRVWAYQVNTTPEQDRHLVEVMNGDPNRHLYRLKKTNCADFVANLVNLYYPGAVHTDRIADYGLMTPKEVARCVTDYAQAHPGLDLKVWDIPQIPGSLRRSRPVRGGAESALKTKRYLFTLLAIQPEIPAALTVLYLWHGRWKVGEGAQPWPETPENLLQTMQAHSAGAASSSIKSEPLSAGQSPAGPAQATQPVPTQSSGETTVSSQ